MNLAKVDINVVECSSFLIGVLDDYGFRLISESNVQICYKLSESLFNSMETLCYKDEGLRFVSL